MPIKAYQGSPNLIQSEPDYPLGRYKDEFIGSGEGAQAYGHGHYFAENPEVANTYRYVNSGIDPDETTYDGKPISHHYNEAMAAKDAADRKRVSGPAMSRLNAKAGFWEKLMTNWHPDNAISEANTEDFGWPEYTKFANSLDRSKFNVPKAGHMYEVAINAHPDHFLDWDKPLSEQPLIVQDMARNADLTHLKPGNRTRRQIEMWRDGTLPNKESEPTGNVLHSALTDYGTDLAGQRALSKKMQDAGIPGIKYLDQSSRGKGEGTRNYVVFDPSHVDIKNRYAKGGIAKAEGGEVDNQPENDLLQPIGKSKTAGAEKPLFDDGIYKAAVAETPWSNRKSIRYIHHDDEGNPIGAMQIMTHGPKTKTATIQNVYVAEKYRRQKIASGLLARARQDFDVRHSKDLTLQGKNFAKAVKNTGGYVHKAESGPIAAPVGGFPGMKAMPTLSAPQNTQATQAMMAAIPRMQESGPVSNTGYAPYTPTALPQRLAAVGVQPKVVPMSPEATALMKQYPTATRDQVSELDRMIQAGGDRGASLSAMQAYGPTSGMKELQPWSPEYKGDSYKASRPVDAFGNPVGWTAPAKAAPTTGADGVPSGWDPKDWANFQENYNPGMPDPEYIINNPWQDGKIGGPAFVGSLNLDRLKPSPAKDSMFNRVAGYTGAGNEGFAYNKALDKFNEGRVAANNAVTSQMENMYSPDNIGSLTPVDANQARMDAVTQAAQTQGMGAAQTLGGAPLPGQQSSYFSAPTNLSAGNALQLGFSAVGATPLAPLGYLANAILTGTNAIPQAGDTGNRALNAIAQQGRMTDWGADAVNWGWRQLGGEAMPARATGGRAQACKESRKAIMIARAMGGRIGKAGGGELPLVGPTPDMATDLPSLRSQVPLETVYQGEDEQPSRSWGNIATPPANQENVLNAEAVAPVYTSRVHELLTNPSALNRMKMGRPQQWVKYLQKGGAKPEEINMYGIGEGDPNTKISRDEVHGRIAGKIPQLREKLLGEGGTGGGDLELNHSDWETDEPDDDWLYENAKDRRLEDIRENRNDPDFMLPYVEDAANNFSRTWLTRFDKDTFKNPNEHDPEKLNAFVKTARKGDLLSKDTAEQLHNAAQNKQITREQWHNAVDEMNNNLVAKFERGDKGEVEDHTHHYERAVHALHGTTRPDFSEHLEKAALDDDKALDKHVDQEREWYYQDSESPRSKSISVSNPKGRDLNYDIRDNGGYGGDIYVSDHRGNSVGNVDSEDEAEELIRSHAAKQLGLSGTDNGQKNIDKPNVHDVGVYGEGSQYSLPGVTDFREHTLHFDPDNYRGFTEGHYDPNAVVHMRYGTVNDDKGKRLLYLDELQSDWHQKGMSRGYDNPEGREAQKTAQVRYDAAEKELEGHRNHIASGLGFAGTGMGADEYAAMMVMTPEDADVHKHTVFRKYNGLVNRDPDLARAMFGKPSDNLTAPELVKSFQDYSKSAFGDDYKNHATALSSALGKANNLRQAVQGNLLPDAPWKNTSEWSKLAMKRALRIAADYGYDGVALSPGWVQKERWGNEDHQKTYDDLMGGSMRSLAKQEGLNFGTASIPLLRKHAQNTRVSGVDNPDQAHAIYLEDEHKDKIRKKGFKLFKQGGYVPMKNSSAVEQALKLTSKSGATLPAAVFLARQHQRRD